MDSFQSAPRRARRAATARRVCFLTELSEIPSEPATSASVMPGEVPHGDDLSLATWQRPQRHTERQSQNGRFGRVADVAVGDWRRAAATGGVDSEVGGDTDDPRRAVWQCPNPVPGAQSPGQCLGGDVFGVGDVAEDPQCDAERGQDQLRKRCLEAEAAVLSHHLINVRAPVPGDRAVTRGRLLTLR